uniref:Uncharacterized protein n=1 Tax=Rhizophora mucronata TaxID=61149 RepID=A0A2P2PJH9_RHIMU
MQITGVFICLLEPADSYFIADDISLKNFLSKIFLLG